MGDNIDARLAMDSDGADSDSSGSWVPREDPYTGETLYDRAPRVDDPELDADLVEMNWGQLISEVRRLRAGIRKHRDATGHDLCHWQPELWTLLPVAETRKLPVIPPWGEFMTRCAAYRASLDKDE